MGCCRVKSDRDSEVGVFVPSQKSVRVGLCKQDELQASTSSGTPSTPSPTSNMPSNEPTKSEGAQKSKGDEVPPEVAETAKDNTSTKDTVCCIGQMSIEVSANASL